MLSLILVFGFFLVELVGGIWTNSLALISDAGHMFSDVGALGFSLVASPGRLNLPPRPKPMVTIVWKSWRP